VAERLRQVADEAEAERAKSLVTDKVTTAIKNSLKGQIEASGLFSKKHGLIHLRNGMFNLYNDPPVLEPLTPDDFSRN
jgi:hypothetical protein